MGDIFLKGDYIVLTSCADVQRDVGAINGGHDGIDNEIKSFWLHLHCRAHKS
jgi:hypothetical protein